MSVAVIFIAGRVIADPAPGTPGNAGNRNPHGAPPGQGGTAPGNSGTSNPHGTPPGQRIPPATAPGSPVGSGRAGSPGVRPVPTMTPGFAGSTERDVEDDLDDSRRSVERWIDWLDRVRGWEPGWLDEFMELQEGRVEVTRSVTRGGVTVVTEVVWERAGDRFGGWSKPHGEPKHEWRIHPPTKFARIGSGPWVGTPVGPMQRLLSGPGRAGSRMSGVWQLSPNAKRTEPGGMVRVSWTRKPEGGSMEWYIDPGTWLLRRMEARNALGRLEWQEERDYRTLDGRPVMTRRLRRTYEPVQQTEEERIRWAPTPAGSALTQAGLSLP